MLSTPPEVAVGTPCDVFLPEDCWPAFQPSPWPVAQHALPCQVVPLSASACAPLPSVFVSPDVVPVLFACAPVVVLLLLPFFQPNVPASLLLASHYPPGQFVSKH